MSDVAIMLLTKDNSLDLLIRKVNARENFMSLRSIAAELSAVSQGCEDPIAAELFKNLSERLNALIP